MTVKPAFNFQMPLVDAVAWWLALNPAGFGRHPTARRAREPAVQYAYGGKAVVLSKGDEEARDFPPYSPTLADADHPGAAPWMHYRSTKSPECDRKRTGLFE